MSKYYNVRQLDATDCAAACLASVSHYYGFELTISKLRDICGTDSKGTNINGLINACEKMNFEAKAVRVPIEDFYKINLKMPLIAHGITKYNMTHYIVVYTAKKKYLVVADPSSNKRKMSKEDFEKFYDGVCILLQPNSDFVGSKTKTTSLFSEFLKFLFPHKKLFISAIISSIILTLVGVISNFFNQILIDDILPYLQLPDHIIMHIVNFK